MGFHSPRHRFKKDNPIVKRFDALVREWKSGEEGIRRTQVLFCLAPVMALFMVEIMNEKNPFTNLSFTELLMNMIWYVILLFVLWVIFGRRRRAAAVYIGLMFSIGYVNHFLVEYRGRILLPHDVMSWRTAANVSSEYSFAPDVFVISAAILGFVYLVLVKFFMVPQQEREYLRDKRVSLGLAAFSLVYSAAFFLTPWLPSMGIKAQQWKTQSNGFVLNFSLALRYSRVNAPEGYSVELLQEMTEGLEQEQAEEMPLTLYSAPYIASQYEEATRDKGTVPREVLTVTREENGTQPVNIIAIMDESFADMAIFDTLEVSQDTVPFYHSLKKNTVKGWMYSPVTGAGTANVEYEFLTGNSVSFLPAETTAYELYVRDKMPSLISWAEDLGFSTTTMHPYFSSGWNRTQVYQYFGVQRQLYDSDFILPTLTRGYISDKSDFEKLEQLTEQAGGRKNFIFNVTMQNHGGYAQGWDNLIRNVILTGRMAGTSFYTEQYLNLMFQTDQQLEELIDYYSHVEEPTMIVLFGDHQGKLSTWFYENMLYRKAMDDRTLEELERLYVAPFLIWTNYDSQQASDVMLSTNYLGALMARLSNYPTTPYQDYLLRMYEELPMINTQGFINREGLLTDDAAQLTQEQQTLLQQYEWMSYYNLFTKERSDSIDQRFFHAAGNP